MRFHDPNRPHMGGRPAFSPPIAVLPELTLMPSYYHQGQVILSAMLAKDANSFARHSVHVLPEAVPDLLTHYERDPEGFLSATFNWWPPSAPKPRPAIIDLGELGLL